MQYYRGYIGTRHVVTVIEHNVSQAYQRAVYSLRFSRGWPDSAMPYLELRDEGYVHGPARVVWAKEPWAEKSRGDSVDHELKYLDMCSPTARLDPLELGVLAHKAAEAAVVNMDLGGLELRVLASMAADDAVDLHSLRAVVEDIPRDEAKRRNYREAYGPQTGPAPKYADDPTYEAKPAKWEDGKGWVNLYRRDTGSAGAGGIYASKADAQYIADKHGNGGRNVPVLITWKPYAEAKPAASKPQRPPVEDRRGWRNLSSANREYYRDRLAEELRKYTRPGQYISTVYITPDVLRNDFVVITAADPDWRGGRHVLRGWLQARGVGYGTPSDRKSCTRVEWSELRRLLTVGRG